MRPTCIALDAVLGNPYPVLDHGHVRVVDYMGNDAAIVQAARVSYGEGTKSLSEDETLIRYLKRHLHTTPFEMCEIKLHMRLPIFVARQLIRHRTANVNEYSARYSVVPDLFYIPSLDQIRTQSETNRQGRGDLLDDFDAGKFRMELEETSRRDYNSYNDALETGVARELARLHLPVNIYTEWYWKIDLHNLMHFQSLRDDAHAQWEIREYAKVIDHILKLWVPMAHGAYKDYVKESHTFSGPEMALLKNLFNQEDDDVSRWVFPETMSKRERAEFNSVLTTQK
jgi:thymidylate synthase (FAD)